MPFSARSGFLTPQVASGGNTEFGFSTWAEYSAETLTWDYDGVTTRSASSVALTLTHNTGVYSYLGGSLHPNGKIYYSPFESTDRIMEYNPSDDSVNEISMGTTTSIKYQCCVTGADEKVYFFPRDGFEIIVYDPSNGQFTFTDYGLSSTNPYLYISAVRSGKYVIGCPGGADHILVIDTELQTAIKHPTTIAANPGALWASSCVDKNGNVILGPYNASIGRIINPVTGTVQNFTGFTSQNTQGCISAPNGFIYFGVHNSTNQIRRLDVDTLTVTEVATGNKTNMAFLGPDGRIYFGARSDGNNANMLDPDTETSTVVSSSEFPNVVYANFIVLPDGVVYSFDPETQTMYKLQRGGTPTPNSLDFTKAVNSDWMIAR